MEGADSGFGLLGGRGFAEERLCVREPRRAKLSRLFTSATRQALIDHCIADHVSEGTKSVVSDGEQLR